MFYFTCDRSFTGAADVDNNVVAMEWLSAQLGTDWVRWNQRDSHSTGESLEARYRAFQQVSNQNQLPLVDTSLRSYFRLLSAVRVTWNKC